VTGFMAGVMRAARTLALAFMIICAIRPAHAHHSNAMYDMNAKLQLTGTVREFQWTNPHCYVQLLVKNHQGKEEEWSLEMGAVFELFNKGWRRSTLKAGDRISVTVAPLRKGGSAGLLIKATTAGGKPLVPEAK
jgi:hypothetical protein